MLLLIYFFNLLLLSDQVEYKSNEPIIITVNINADSVYAAETVFYEKEFLNYQKETGQISKEEFDQKIQDTLISTASYAVIDNRNWKNKASIEILNNETRAWEKYPGKINLIEDEADTSFLLIERNGYYYIDWGIDPEDVEKMNPGTIKIRGKLLVRNQENNSTDSIYSEPQTLTIAKEKRSLNDSEYIQQLCTYFTRRGLYEKAMGYAQMFGEISDNEYQNNVLMGNIYERMGDYNNAIKAYMTAKGSVGDYPHQFDEYIDQKIQDILEQSPESMNQFLNKRTE
ncbi:MAG: hypothetical protein JW798_05060 [Prolixibacteraceae bacterium]|nr:hypothetical protein [Prolixibacteraceae bacterium]